MRSASNTSPRPPCLHAFRRRGATHSTGHLAWLAVGGQLYVLDEPTIGLHSRDTVRLIRILEKLRDLGNTIIVVEHDADVLRAADYLLDLGPGAGEFGGKLLAEACWRRLRPIPTRSPGAISPANSPSPSHAPPRSRP